MGKRNASEELGRIRMEMADRTTEESLEENLPEK